MEKTKPIQRLKNRCHAGGTYLKESELKNVVRGGKPDDPRGMIE